MKPDLTERILHRATVNEAPIFVLCGLLRCNHRLFPDSDERCHATYHHNYYSYRKRQYFYDFKPKYVEVGKNFIFTSSILDDFVLDTFLKHTTGIQHVEKYNTLYANALQNLPSLVKGSIRVQPQLTYHIYHKAMKIYLLHQFLVKSFGTDISFPNTCKLSTLLATIQPFIKDTCLRLHHPSSRKGKTIYLFLNIYIYGYLCILFNIIYWLIYNIIFRM
jgi:hypothetical protein